MTDLYYVDQPKTLDLISTPDRSRFGEIYNLIGANTSLTDRTGFIKIPFTVAAAPELKVPYGTALSLREATDLRVRELLNIQDQLNVPIHVYYSGGIDSSYVLSSLLSRMTPEAASERLVVAMTTESIFENPTLYQKFIRGKIRVVPGDDFSKCLDLQKIVISGELGDQLFGSDIMMAAKSLFGEDRIFDCHYYDPAFEIFQHVGISVSSAERWLHLITTSAESFGFQVYNLHDLLWWYNFTCKWQGVYFRMMAYSVPTYRENAKKAVDEGYYQNFFASRELQLWSFVNQKTGVKYKRELSWPGYKYPMKEEIYKLTGDEYYLQNKIKSGSLWKCLRNKFKAKAITSDYQFIDDLTGLDLYNPENSFR